jgi:hypothetical protein
MSFRQAVRAWPALQSAEADNEALSCVLMLESASSLAVSLTRSAPEVFFIQQAHLAFDRRPILDYIATRTAREKLRLRREQCHRRRIRA